MLRWVALLLMGILVGLQYQLWFGVGGVKDVRRLEAAVAAQHQLNAGLKTRNERLYAEVQDLKLGREAVEERARVELGMVKPDEVFYQVVNAPPPAAVTPGTRNLVAVAPGAAPVAVQEPTALE